MKKYLAVISVILINSCTTTTNISQSSSIPQPQLTVTPSVIPVPTSSNQATSPVYPSPVQTSIIPTTYPTTFTTPIPYQTPIPIIRVENALELDTKAHSGYYKHFVSMNNKGDFVLAYNTLRRDNYNDYLDVYIRLFDNKGVAISPEIEIKQNAVVNDISIEQNNNFVVLYQVSGGGLYARKYDSNGKPLTEEILINNRITIKTDVDNFAVIKKTSKDEFIISFITENSQNLEIVTQKFDSLLKPINDKSTVPINEITQIHNAVDKNGNYYLSWNSQDEISVVKFDAGNKILLDKKELFVSNFKNFPHDIICDNTNNLIITWFKKYDYYDIYQRKTDSYNAVYISKYDSNLSTFNQERVSLDALETDLSKPSIAVDSNNTLTVAWTAKDRIFKYSNILIRKYNNNFEPLIKETVISQLPNSESAVSIFNDNNDNLSFILRGSGDKGYFKKYDKNLNQLR